MDTLRGLFAAFFIGTNTALACVPLYTMGIVRAMLPGQAKHRLSGAMDYIIDYWTGCNRWLFRALNLCEVELDMGTGAKLERNQWYMVTCNHQSWVDIVLLQTQFRHHLPPLKFFTKQQLIWLPFLGIALWLLGFPYVRRASASQVQANPELKNQDRNSTLAACQAFKRHPTAVLNFLEGTRFTQAKHQAQDARFEHLLNPKIGGLAYVLEGMGDTLCGLLDITISYPDGTAPTFWDFLCGRCRRARIQTQLRPIPAQVAQQLIHNDKTPLADWVEQMWHTKDQTLAAQAKRNG